GVNALTMNKRSFDRLPAEIQKILMEEGRNYEAQAGQSLNARQESGLKGLKEVGANIKELGEDARAGWAQSLAEFPSQQAKEADGRGMPGTEVMKAYLDAVAATGYQWPYEYSID
ncbi:MAG: C4-dicarboxylate ABC transporter substrate-binding protein, partial [Pseudomonadota bacterium]